MEGNGADVVATSSTVQTKGKGKGLPPPPPPPSRRGEKKEALPKWKLPGFVSQKVWDTEAFKKKWADNPRRVEALEHLEKRKRDNGIIGEPDEEIEGKLKSVVESFAEYLRIFAAHYCRELDKSSDLVGLLRLFQEVQGKALQTLTGSDAESLWRDEKRPVAYYRQRGLNPYGGYRFKALTEAQQKFETRWKGKVEEAKTIKEIFESLRDQPLPAFARQGRTEVSGRGETVSACEVKIKDRSLPDLKWFVTQIANSIEKYITKRRAAIASDILATVAVLHRRSSEAATREVSMDTKIRKRVESITESKALGQRLLTLRKHSIQGVSPTFFSSLYGLAKVLSCCCQIFSKANCTRIQKWMRQIGAIVQGEKMRHQETDLTTHHYPFYLSDSVSFNVFEELYEVLRELKYIYYKMSNMESPRKKESDENEELEKKAQLLDKEKKFSLFLEKTPATIFRTVNAALESALELDAIVTELMDVKKSNADKDFVRLHMKKVFEKLDSVFEALTYGKNVFVLASSSQKCQVEARPCLSQNLDTRRTSVYPRSVFEDEQRQLSERKHGQEESAKRGRKVDVEPAAKRQRR